MATISAVRMTRAEYDNTTFRPDQEWIDGELKGRNVGKYEHARLQALLTIWFGQHEKEWGVKVLTEQRVEISPDRVRIPDLALVERGSHPPVLTHPPVLVVEILSPKDSYQDIRERAIDYRTMGIEIVWIIDPKTRSGQMLSRGAWVDANILTVPGKPILVDLNNLFEDLDIE